MSCILHNKANHANGAVRGARIVSHAEVHEANIIVCVCDSLRTAASVHIAKWSPDGEYFATVGKVYHLLTTFQNNTISCSLG